jgi:mycothiol synthase
VSLAEFAARIRAHDGVDAFNEESRLAIADGRPGRVEIVVTDGPQIVAAAYAAKNAPVDLAVHPLHRRHGHGTSLVDRLLTAGEARFWAHGDLEAARHLATASGLSVGRTLVRMQWSSAPSPVELPPGLTIRTFRSDDLPELLAVNARAFIDHPEQGSLDVDGFNRRAEAPWFSPDGLFVAERDRSIVGFHWTKKDGDGGEVYVLGVDPSAQGAGIASALLRTGLQHLTDQGVDTVDLYVEGDNLPALALYERFGFAESARDVLYVSRTPEAGDPVRA